MAKANQADPGRTFVARLAAVGMFVGVAIWDTLLSRRQPGATRPAEPTPDRPLPPDDPCAALAAPLGASFSTSADCDPTNPITCNPDPFAWDEPTVRDEIQTLIAGGETDALTLAVAVAENLYGDHPELGAIVYPPISPNPGVQCVWARILLIARQVAPGDQPPPPPPVAPKPPPPPGPGADLPPLFPTDEGVDWVEGSISDLGLDISDYPWERPLIHPSSPTPGMHFQVPSFGGVLSTLEGIVRNSTAAWLVFTGRKDLVSAMNPNNAGFQEEWARRLRRQMKQAIVCGWWHDTTYGQTDIEKAGGTQWAMNTQGRGLNFTPVHVNQRSRLQAGAAALRNTTLAGNRSGQYAEGAQINQMFLFIPAPLLVAPSTPAEDLELVFGTWSDGTSTINPTPTVTDLGIEGMLFEGGCPGVDQ